MWIIFSVWAESFFFKVCFLEKYMYLYNNHSSKSSWLFIISEWNYEHEHNFGIIGKPIKNAVIWYAYLKMSNLGDIPHYNGADHNIIIIIISIIIIIIGSLLYPTAERRPLHATSLHASCIQVSLVPQQFYPAILPLVCLVFFYHRVVFIRLSVLSISRRPIAQCDLPNSNLYSLTVLMMSLTPVFFSQSDLCFFFDLFLWH